MLRTTFTFLFFLLFSLFSVTTAFSQTVVNSGFVSGRWTKANSPYQVKGMIVVPNDSTLIIDPGVVIDFQGPYKMSVRGRLLAVGLPNDSIQFTTTTVIIDSVPIPTGRWTGIEFLSLDNTNDTSKFMYCKIYGAGGEFPNNAYALSITQWSRVKIHHCLFERNRNIALYTYGCSPEIKNNTFTRNEGTAISASDQWPLIESNLIVNNKGMGIYLWWSFASVVNNIIANNGTPFTWQSGGIKIEGYGRTYIANNTIVNNFSQNNAGGLFIESLIAGRDPLVQPVIANNIIRGNRIQNGLTQIYISQDESDPDFYNNNIEGGLAGFSIGSSAIFSGKYLQNIDTVPLFQQTDTSVGYQVAPVPSINKWSLLSNSGCIDKGSATWPSTDNDIAGNPRVNVCKIDMGAFEFVKGSALIVKLQAQSPRCFKEKNGTIQALVSGGAPPYSLLWNTGSTQSSLSNLDSGKYTLTVSTAADGCVMSKSVNLFRPDSFYITLGNDTNIICRDSVRLSMISTNYANILGLTYKWSPANQLSSDSVAKPYFKMITPQKIGLTVTTPEGCKLTDSIQIWARPISTAELCIVTVNENNHNVIVWNKNMNPLIESYRLKKETNITNQYQLLIEQPFNAMSVFVDTLSNALMQSNKYRLEYIDQCGIFSYESAPHKTMHLSINKGQGNTWNLIWDAYEGVMVNTYNIYRGSQANNLQLIGTSSGSNSQYSDINPPAGGQFYQVEVILGNACNPSKTYNSSRSNIASTDKIGLQENKATHFADVYPNPTSGDITVSLQQNAGEALKVTLSDLTGKTLQSWDLPILSGLQNHQLNLSEIKSGLYLVSIEHGDAKQMIKVLIH